MALTKVTGAGLGNVDGPVGVGTASADASALLTLNKSPTAAFGNPVLQVGGSTYTSGGYYSIGLGYTNATYTEPPAEIAYVPTSDSGGTTGYLTFGTRSVTTNTAVTESMRIDGYGHVTMPKQSAFLVNPSSNQSNIAVNATTTIAFGTERFDQNGDFASNTFTAPVTGRYQFNLFSFINSLNHGYSIFQVRLNTSNITMTWIIDPRFGDENPNYYPVHFSTLVDMDANDTAHVEMVIPNYGSAQVDFDASSYFSGYLVA